MESIARPRIVIAGTNSGVGKTTIVTGLLAYFHSKGYVATGSFRQYSSSYGLSASFTPVPQEISM